MLSVVAGIPKRFKYLLKVKGYEKLSDFVKDTGLPKTTVYGVASGKTIPRLDTIEIICDKLGVGFLEFFSYVKEKREKKVDYAVHLMGKEDLIEIYDELDEDERKQLNIFAEFLISKRKS